MTNQPPVRLCCGERHYGPQCPDGLVMCSMCFCRFTIDELSCSPEGIKWDMCLKCEEMEKRNLEFIKIHGKKPIPAPNQTLESCPVDSPSPSSQD